MELRSTALEVGGLMSETRLQTRRSGMTLLALVVTSNFVPWMELLVGTSATAELVNPTEYRVAVGSGFLAAVLILSAWLIGRRRPEPAAPRIARPRRTGLRLAALAVASNLLLTGAIHWLGTNPRFDPSTELAVFAAIWYLVMLPLEAVAAYCKGRASKPVVLSVQA